MSFSNKQRIIAGSVAVALIITGVLIFLFSDKYRFRAKPEWNTIKSGLTQISTKDRQPITSDFCLSRLPEQLHSAYETLDKYVRENTGESFWLSDITIDEFRSVFEAYTSDHPEVFWLSSESAFSYYQMDTELEVELNFTHSGDALATAKQYLNDAIDKAFTYAPDKADDLEMEVFINDYLVTHCEYKSGAEMSHNAYGALVSGNAVCDGYSHAFQLLCNRMGISCSVVEGTSDFNDDKDTGHMWNCVLLGNDWYHADVTWNDISEAKFFCERYFYLNLSDKEIKSDHRTAPLFDSGSYKSGSFNVFLPECKSDKLRYLNMYCPTVTDLNKDGDMIGALITAAENKDESCGFIIADSLPYKETCDSIIKDGAMNEWIEGANHYLDQKHQIGSETRVYTYQNKNVLIAELTY